MKSWIRHFLPFALVRASQITGELRRLGLPSAAARRLGFRSSTPVQMANLNLSLLPEGALAQVGWVIDIGANVGDWTAALHEFCLPARTLCIEPDPKLAAGLRQRFASRTSVEIAEVAVGATAGEAEFKIMQNAVLNSFRNPTAGMAALFPDPFQIKEIIRVQVRPLDALVPAGQRVTLLKIDAQGFEREVLAGAKETLRRTDYVLIEVNFQPHYEGEAGFIELDGIMQSHGFCISNYSPPRGGKRQALFADMLYLRKDS